MIHRPLLPQASRPWRPYETDRGRFDHGNTGESPPSSSGRLSSLSVTVIKGPYSTVTAAQTAVPPHIRTASEIQLISRSITTAAVPRYHQQHAGYVLPMVAALQTFEDSSKGSSASPQRAKAATAAEIEASWLAWISGSAPPAHARSLYETVPLPPDDSLRVLEAHPPRREARIPNEPLEALSLPCETAREADPNPHQFPPTVKQCALLLEQIELHPVLGRACVSRTPPSIHAVSCSLSSSSRPTDWTRVSDAPATSPSVGHLTLVVEPTGQTLCVRPTSLTNPHVVTVRDVLETLENAAMTLDYVCRGRCGSSRGPAPICFGGRLSVTLNCLQLWWRMLDGTEVEPHPWQVVVRPR